MKYILVFFMILNMMLSNLYATNIAVSIKPLYSLVKDLTAGIDEVNLILNSNNTPHHIELSYEQQKIIKNAEILIVASKNFEVEIVNAMKNKDKIIALDSFTNLSLYNFSTETFLNKNHKGKNHTGGDSHHQEHINHKNHEDKQHNENKHNEDKHNDDKKHNHNHSVDVLDYHFWLDIDKNLVMLEQLTQLLIKKNPSQEAKYKNNLANLKTKLLKLSVQMKQIIDKDKIGNFMVYHNGWQYFIKSYKLPFKGNIIVVEGDNHESLISAKALLALEKYIQSQQIKCIFIEPQFEDKVLLSFIQNNKIAYFTMDPIGNNLDINNDLYANMMLNNAKSLVQCTK